VNPYIYGNGTTSAVQIGAGLVTYGNTYGFQNIGTSNYVYNLQTYNAGQANGIKVNGVTSNYAEFLIGSFTFTSNSTLGTVQIGATQYDWSGGEYDQIHFNSTGSAATPDSSEGAMGVATMTITVSSVPEPPSIAALVGMVLTGGVLWVVYRRRSAKLAVAS
jgi:hypothetical protein